MKTLMVSVSLALLAGSVVAKEPVDREERPGLDRPRLGCYEEQHKKECRDPEQGEWCVRCGGWLKLPRRGAFEGIRYCRCDRGVPEIKPKR